MDEHVETLEKWLREPGSYGPQAGSPAEQAIRALLAERDATQKEMIREAMQAIEQRKPGRNKLVYDKTRRTIVAVSTMDVSRKFERALAAEKVERLTLMGEIGRLRTRIGAALALHKRVEDRLLPDGCAECSADWPCPTVKALRGEK
jgi:hypothetical protein